MFVKGLRWTSLLLVVLSVVVGKVTASELSSSPDDPPHADSSVPVAPLGIDQEVLNPPRSLSFDSPAFLPVMNYLGQDKVCESWISVQYIGCEPAKVTLIVWGERGFCPPQAAGPMNAKCSGLLTSYRSWVFLGAQVPERARGGAIFRFSAMRLSEVPGNPGPSLADDFGFDDVIADLMCETLFFTIISCPEYHPFHAAYMRDLVYETFPMSLAKGSGAMAVSVQRECEIDGGTSTLTSAYRALTISDISTFKPNDPSETYLLPTVYSSHEGRSSVIYAQNAGTGRCATVEIWFKNQDDCIGTRLCSTDWLAGAETLTIDPRDCVGSGWIGSARIHSTQPLAVAVDTLSSRTMTTYLAEQHPIDFMGEAVPDHDIQAPSGIQRSYVGALAYSGEEGWDSRVQVMNQASYSNAKVRISFFDPSGARRATLIDWLCPLGRRDYRLELIAGIPSSWRGTVRVDSLDMPAGISGSSVAAPLSSLLEMERREDAAGVEVSQAVQYPLEPVGGRLTYFSKNELDPSEAKVGKIAIPRLVRREGPDQATSVLAIANASPNPGFTDLAIYLYDKNGLLDFTCLSLQTRQSRRVDLESWSFIPTAFHASAVVSATYWEQPGPPGSSSSGVDNAPSLSTIVLERPASMDHDLRSQGRSVAIPGRPFHLQEPLLDLSGGWCDLSSLPQCH